MGRRRQNGVELVAALPWPVGIVLGILGFVAIRYGLVLLGKRLDRRAGDGAAAFTPNSSKPLLRSLR